MAVPGREVGSQFVAAESFSVKQTTNLVQVEKIHPPSVIIEVEKSHPPSVIIDVEKIPASPFIMMIVQREKISSLKDGFSNIVFNEITTVFLETLSKGSPFVETPENWIAKVNRIKKKSIGPDGEVVEEGFDLKKEVNHKNEYVKNKLDEAGTKESFREFENRMVRNKVRKKMMWGWVPHLLDLWVLNWGFSIFFLWWMRWGPQPNLRGVRGLQSSIYLSLHYRIAS